METKYMLEIKAGERYAIQKFTFGEPISFPQFRLTVAEPGESGRMKVSMELLALMTVANCGVRGGHYSAGAVLELVFDPSGNAFAYAYDTRGEEFRFRIMSTDALLDRFSGCILGGAVGDALGYAVEFERYDDIIELYGEDGIRNFSLENGKALISDDTQMTLFTMEGLSSGIFRADSKGVGAAAETYVNWAYCDWYVTQAGREDYSPFTPIFADRRLHEWRAPGNTCLQALGAQFENSAFVPYSARYGTLGKPVNDSKGCGAVMRAAPVGLMLSSNNYKGESTALVAAKTGAITHGHTLGWLPAAFLASLVHGMIYPLDSAEYCAHDLPFASYVMHKLDMFKAEFAETPHIDEFAALCSYALKLARFGEDFDVEQIHSIGGGWVGDEALAIALYAAAKYENDFDAAICCAVNHSGDSDSTGSIAGNILGAYHGLANIMRGSRFDLEQLELCDLMRESCKRAVRAAFLQVIR